MSAGEGCEAAVSANTRMGGRFPLKLNGSFHKSYIMPVILREVKHGA